MQKKMYVTHEIDFLLMYEIVSGIEPVISVIKLLIDED